MKAPEFVVSVAPGLKNLGSDIADEFSRQASLGASELIAGIFNGSAFVLYGPTRDRSAEQANEQSQEHQREGMER
jgi:hypothetical protein